MSSSVSRTLSSEKSFWFFIGPAFLVSVGYMDPGNWATSIEARSRYGYDLLWVITLASIIAILMQVLSAKLGIATGKNLAQLIRIEHPKKTGTFLLSSAALGMVATDLTEILPEYCREALQEAIPAFNKKIKGFAREYALLTGVETRTS